MLVDILTKAMTVLWAVTGDSGGGLWGGGCGGGGAGKGPRGGTEEDSNLPASVFPPSWSADFDQW